MIDKLERLLDKWFKTTPKDTYTKLLEQFEQPHVGIPELPVMLCEFWKRLRVGHFHGGPTPRDMMYIPLELRHETIGGLVATLQLASGAIVHDDEGMLMEISQTQFQQIHKITFDDYFSGVRGVPLSFNDGVRQIKQAMEVHADAIENLTSTYSSRVLNRMYNDILVVTRALIANMKEGK